MVTACRDYITDGGQCRIWDQSTVPLVARLKECLKLNDEYQACYQKTKKRSAEQPGERPFEFSEMYIFGKFDTFCRRLNKVKIFI